jgi:hypothetical protein
MVIILNHKKPSIDDHFLVSSFETLNLNCWMDGESVNSEFGSFRHDRLPSSFEQRQGWSYDANLSARKKPLNNSKF